MTYPLIFSYSKFSRSHVLPSFYTLSDSEFYCFIFHVSGQCFWNISLIYLENYYWDVIKTLLIDENRLHVSQGHQSYSQHFFFIAGFKVITFNLKRAIETWQHEEHVVAVELKSTATKPKLHGFKGEEGKTYHNSSSSFFSTLSCILKSSNGQINM